MHDMILAFLSTVAFEDPDNPIIEHSPVLGTYTKKRVFTQNYMHANSCNSCARTKRVGVYLFVRVRSLSGMFEKGKANRCRMFERHAMLDRKWLENILDTVSIR